MDGSSVRISVAGGDGEDVETVSIRQVKLEKSRAVIENHGCAEVSARLAEIDP
jgi:hypothetical protein